MVAFAVKEHSATVDKPMFKQYGHRGHEEDWCFEIIGILRIREPGIAAEEDE